MIGKIVRAILGGLFLAGFVHIVAVLAIPVVAPRDAAERVFAAADPETVTVLPADGSVLPDLDPAFVNAVCPFDIGDGPLAVTGTMPDTVWSFAVVAAGDGIVASFERSAAVNDRLDAIVADPDTTETIRLARAADGTSTTSYAPVTTDRGFVLIRAFADPDHPRAAVEDALKALDCGPPDG